MTNLAAPMSTPIPPSGSEERPATISHVLVCLDRSGAAEGCLPYAAFAANAFGARVTLLHVLLSPQASEFNRADALEAEIARREAEAYLDRATASLGLENAETVSRVAQGFPAEQIAVVAREIAADLTILSSHGKGDSVAPVLGSIAQHVLSTVDGSVLLVQPSSKMAIPPKRIMVPLDGSVRSECVLPMATAMARAHGVEVLLVYIVREPTVTAVLSDPQDMQLALKLADRVETNARAYLAKIRSRLVAEAIVATTLVLRASDARQALLDIAVEHECDMLVLTAHGSTSNGQHSFGSVTSFLLSHAQLPIFVLQDMPRRPRGPARRDSLRFAPGSRLAETV